jgi:hypothetical protein
MILDTRTHRTICAAVKNGRNLEEERWWGALKSAWHVEDRERETIRIIYRMPQRQRYQNQTKHQQRGQSNAHEQTRYAARNEERKQENSQQGRRPGIPGFQVSLHQLRSAVKVYLLLGERRFRRLSPGRYLADWDPIHVDAVR